MIELIISDIYLALMQYAPLALLSGGAVVLVLYFIRFLLFGKEQSDQRRFRSVYALIYVLSSYCFIVVSITLLSREPGSRDGLDLIPLSTFSPILWNNRYPIENIILFVPFGFILPFINKLLRNLYLILGMGFGFSMLIELIQYCTKRGYFQTDDVLTNVLGTIIGYIGAYGSQRLIHTLTQKTVSEER